MTMYRKTRVEMICSYDSDADAAYIYLDHPVPNAGAQKMLTFDTAIGMFNLDLNNQGHVLGLEILGASQHLPPALLTAILQNRKPVVELP